MGGTTFTALGSQELSLKDLKDYPLICLGKETMTFQFYNKLFFVLWAGTGAGYRDSNHRSDTATGKE